MVNLASFASISLTKQMYGWSKWGGARKGIVKEDLDTWYCQCCKEEQTKGLPAYMYDYGDGDYLRICSKCWAMVKNGFTYTQVRISVRRGMWVDNLMEDWID